MFLVRFSLLFFCFAGSGATSCWLVTKCQRPSGQSGQERSATARSLDGLHVNKLKISLHHHRQSHINIPMAKDEEESIPLTHASSCIPGGEDAGLEDTGGFHSYRRNERTGLGKQNLMFDV